MFGKRAGAILFIDDPEDKVPLGPIEIQEMTNLKKPNHFYTNCLWSRLECDWIYLILVQRKESGYGG